MKQFIKIDLRTIKINKDAGSTISNIHNGTTCYISFENKQPEIPSILKKYNAIIFSIQGEINKGPFCIKARLIKIPRNFKTLSKKLKKFSYNIHFQHQIIYHEPIPEYSYDYLPTKVKCNECSAKFKHTELRSDICYDGEGDCYMADICPSCSVSDCCDLQFERIDNALNKKSITDVIVKILELYNLC